MTHYKELCDLATRTQNEDADAQKRAYSFGQELVNRYRVYLGCEDGAVRVFPPGSTPKDGQINAVAGVMESDEDGYWCFRVCLTLVGSRRTDRISFDVKLREDGEAFEVQPFNGGPTLRVNPKSGTDFNGVFDELQNTIRKYYASSPTQRARPMQSIGFTQN